MKIETLASADERLSEAVVTKISPAVKDQNRVNIYINDKFYCSLDISQLVDFKIKIGQKLSSAELGSLKRASDFGKFYTRALEYSLTRPHSVKEIRDYLYRKTRDRLVRIKNRKTDQYETIKKPGYDESLIQPVLDRLIERGFVDDEKFAKAWAENRFITKGVSRRRLEQELVKKGISKSIIEQVLSETTRDDKTEIAKIIAKKRSRYDDQKLIQYLVRQGFDYDSVKTAVLETDSQNSE